MKFNRVKSSNVVAVGYDEMLELLGVAYKNGVYLYKGVKSDKWALLQKVESVGKFINTNIKPHHEFDKPVDFKLEFDPEPNENQTLEKHTDEEAN